MNGSVIEGVMGLGGGRGGKTRLAAFTRQHIYLSEIGASPREVFELSDLLSGNCLPNLPTQARSKVYPQSAWRRYPPCRAMHRVCLNFPTSCHRLQSVMFPSYQQSPSTSWTSLEGATQRLCSSTTECPVRAGPNKEISPDPR